MYMHTKPRSFNNVIIKFDGNENLSQWITEWLSERNKGRAGKVKDNFR